MHSLSPSKTPLFLAIGILLLSFFLPSPTLSLRLLLFASAALGLSLFHASCKEACLCSASFLALGAYAAGLTAGSKTDTPTLFLAFFAALLVPFLFALLFGSFLMHGEGEVFSLATFFLGEAVRVFLEGLACTGGAKGFDKSLFALSPLLGLLFFLLVFFLVGRFLGGNFGRMAEAAAEDPLGAMASGVSVSRLRLIAFCLTAILCGGAGFFYLGATGFLFPADLSYHRSCDLLAVIALSAKCGRKSLWPTVLASFLFTLTESAFASLAAVRLLLLGGLFLLLALWGKGVRKGGILWKKC